MRRRLTQLGRELALDRRSRLLIPFIVVSLVLIALLSPVSGSDRGRDVRASSFLSGPNGAKGLHDLARSLGWQTERRVTLGFDSLSSRDVIAVLAPVDELSELEAASLLRQVRRGASLLTVVESPSPLADSLGIAPAGYLTAALAVKTTEKPTCPAGETRSAFQFMGKEALVKPFGSLPLSPDQMRVFLLAGASTGPAFARPAAIGFTLGKGRVIALSDANIIRNDIIRVCKWDIGVRVIGMLEYLSAGKSPAETRLVFDEYHQHFGPQPDIPRAIGRALFQSSPGRMLTQVIIASIVLLLAVSPRPIRPSASKRAERRSPFEHVDALSAAYGQIGATRVVADRLVRGLRRRLAGNAARPALSDDSDQAFLDRVSATHPPLEPQVDLLRSALERRIPPSRLPAIGEAVETIERTLTK
jgi:hypothetical protein